MPIHSFEWNAPLPPGWQTKQIGDECVTYCTNQEHGAIANGTTIRKVREEPSDMTTLGATGIVIGSIYAPPIEPREAKFMYFVEWDHLRGIPVGVVDWKITPVHL